VTEQAGPDRTGPAILDIGQGIGALLLHAPADLRGVEIEVSPVDDPAQRVHTEVLRREWGGRRTHTAIFARLAPGDYVVWAPDGRPRSQVVIGDGSVTEIDWR
jgi:hypothetical protein